MYSNRLSEAGFRHGFGTRRSRSRDLPGNLHILRQVHGERIVVLSKGPRPEGAGSVAPGDPLFRDLPATPFRFEEGDALITDIAGVRVGHTTLIEGEPGPLVVGRGPVRTGVTVGRDVTVDGLFEEGYRAVSKYLPPRDLTPAPLQLIYFFIL